MSRAAANKSRAEKTKGSSSAVPTVTHEIVPGKFSDQDWYSMLDREDGNDFSADLVDEIVDRTLCVIYDNYLDSQLLPFTIAQAKDAVLQIIDWQFLSRDVLETQLEENTTWLGDEEPLPALTDCWAQGIVPRQVLQVTRTPTPQQMVSVIVEEVCSENESNTEQVIENASEDESDDLSEPEPDMESCTSFSTSREGTDVVEPSLPSQRTQVTIEPQPPTRAKPRRKFKAYKGRLKSAGVSTMSESLYETEMRLLAQANAGSVKQEDDVDNPLSAMPLSCQSLLKSQAGRPPGSKDVHYDDHGNVLSVIKFNPAKLPSHFVKTGYRIVDPGVEAAQARLQAMRTGSYVPQNPKKKKVGASNFAKNSITLLSDSSRDEPVEFSSRNIVLPVPPPLIEIMDISPGVVVKEGDRVKRGLKMSGKTGPQVPEGSLRLVRPPPERPRFTTQDILGTETPILRLIRDVPIIPPISQST